MPLRGRPKSSGVLQSQTINVSGHGDVAVRGPGGLNYSSPLLVPGHQNDNQDSGDMTAREQTWQNKDSSTYHMHSNSQPCLAITPDRRPSVDPSFVTSNMSPRPSRGSLSRKQSGGLRAALHRVFGSKRRVKPVSGVSPDIAYSDPGNLMGNGGSQSENYIRRGSYRSSPSLSRSVTRASALRSHAPGNASPSQQHLDVSAPDSPSKRRNTLPSLVLSDQEAQNFARSLNSHLNEIEKTSNTLAANLLDKGRSRSVETSLGGYLLNNSPKTRQDRDSTIAYWRRSAVEDPVPVLLNGTVQENRTQPELGSVAYPPQAQSTIRPAQSFDFGLGVDDGPSNLEDRVNTLEVKLFDFEYAIAKLQGVELTKPQLQPRIPRSKSSHDLIHRYSHVSTSTDSSVRRMMSFSRPRPPVGTATEHDSASTFDQSSKTETIRPTTSHIISSRRSRSPYTSTEWISRAEYDALMALVHDEKAARQQMELQLLNLQKEVEQMQAPVYAAINYPTPEKEEAHETPRAKTLHRTSPFEFSRRLPTSKVLPPLQSRFSMDTEIEFQNDEDQDTFETPKERFTFEINSPSPMRGVTVV